MRNGLLTAAVAVLLLLGFVVAPVQADSIQELAQGASVDFLGFDITGAKPAYQKTSQDWINEGNFWKAQCEAITAGIAEDRAACDTLDDRYARDACDAEIYSKVNRHRDLSRIFLDIVPEPGASSATSSRGKVVMDAAPATPDACENAKRAYSKAFQLTSDDDYEMKAEILEAGAGIYHILGMTDEARQVEEAAAVARDRKAASGLFAALLPLSGWIAIAGILGGLFLLYSSRR